MAEAIGEVLGIAAGIAISPVPVAAVILMLFSDRARVNSLVFLAAWVIGIASVTVVVSFLPGLDADRGDPGDTAGWVKLGLGILLLVAGIRQWRSRPEPDERPTAPAWMSRVETLRPWAAFGLGILLSAVNPKNLLLAAAGGASIAVAELTGAETAAAIVVFTLVAATTVAAPVIAFLVAGDRLTPVLSRIKDWLIANNGPVMAVLFLVFAASLIGDGISVLAA